MSKDKPKSFLRRILDLIFGGGDPEREKKRILKGIEDQLRKRSKIYRVSSQELMPAAGKFFFDIYIVIAPARMLLQNLAKSDQLKNIVIESYLDDNRKRMVTELSPDSIKRRAAGRSIAELQDELRRESHAVTDFLNTSSTANQINLTYAYMRAFSEFISFDFYHLVKQFDASLPEKNLNYKPKFEAVPVNSVIDDLDDFLNVAIPILSEVNWDKLFDILKDYRNTELINREAWRKILGNIREMIKSETFELILRTVKEDPFYEVKVTISAVDIVKPYTSRIKNQIDNYVRQLGQYEKNKAVHKILNEVFGTNSLAPMLVNYSQARSDQMFGSRDVPGFIYAEVLNAIVTFGEDYLKKDVKTLVDLLLLKGKWSQNIHYKDFSHSFQELLSNCSEIFKFDSSLAEESSNMIRLRNSLRAGERDKFAMNTVRGILGEINDDAKDLVFAATQHYVIMGRCLKTYIDDFKLQPKSEIIINWKEIEKTSEKPLGRFMADIYTRIYYLIQMFQYYGREE
jgi:hypothetical protein